MAEISYNIHNCNPVIIPHSTLSESELMTGDNQFIDDKPPHQTYNHVLIRPGEDDEDNEEKGGRKTAQQQTKKGINDAFADDTPIKRSTLMDKHCRNKKCANIDTCLQVLKVLADAKKTQDIDHARDLLRKAEQSSQK